jgi:hypothetical protein
MVRAKSSGASATVSSSSSGSGPNNSANACCAGDGRLFKPTLRTRSST